MQIRLVILNALLKGLSVLGALLVLGVQAAAVVLWASDAQSIQVTDWSGGHSGDLEGTLPGMTIVPFAF